MIQKSAPRIVFFEQRNVWRRSEFAGTGCERECALQRGQLSVDAAVCRAFPLPLANVLRDAVGRDIDCAIQPEEFPQMPDLQPHGFQGALAVDLVIDD